MLKNTRLIYTNTHFSKKWKDFAYVNNQPDGRKSIHLTWKTKYATHTLTVSLKSWTPLSKMSFLLNKAVCNLESLASQSRICPCSELVGPKIICSPVAQIQSIRNSQLLTQLQRNFYYVCKIDLKLIFPKSTCWEVFTVFPQREVFVRTRSHTQPLISHQVAFGYFCERMYLIKGISGFSQKSKWIKSTV